MTLRRDDDAPGESKEQFLTRWSRLKEEARQQPAQPPADKAAPEAPAPELPPIEHLTIDSDYRAFFHPKVGDDLRRAALKKLFSDPHFNVMDGLDVYIDDYSKSEPIPAALLAQLKQAERILEWARGAAREPGKTDASGPAGPRPASTSELGGPPQSQAEAAPIAGDAHAEDHPAAGKQDA